MPRAAATLLTVLPVVFAVADLQRVDPAAMPQCVADMLGLSSPPFEWKPTREGMQCLAAGLLQRTIALERLIALSGQGQSAVLEGLTSLAFKWRAATFSGPCSSTCGTGTRRRTVECVLDGGVTSGTRPILQQVNTVFCDARSRPDELETCNDNSMCTYNWLPLPWGACSNTCGPGTRQRVVHCVRTDAAKTLVNPNLW
jgi:hypothetical protein